MESVQRELPPNPREHANYLSIILITWTIPLFKKGYRKVLKLNDIFRPLTCDRSKTLGDRLEANWSKQIPTLKQRSLLSVIISTFWKDYALLSICCFFNDIILRLGQRLLLGYLLLFFRKGSTVSYQQALAYAGGVIIFNGLNALLSNHIELLSLHNGMKVRVATCSLIYRKALRLSQTAPGKVANLLSNDVNRFDQASVFLNSLWISPLLTIIVGCLLWDEVGVAGILGIVIVLTIVPILSYAAKLTSKFRLKTAIRTDERMRFMDEIISGMQTIKMYAWEKFIEKQISSVRKMELKALRKMSYIRAIHMTATLFTTRTALFCTMFMMVHVNGSEQITATRIFLISSYFSIASYLMSQRFPRGISEIAEVLVAIKRLEKFLNLDEKTFKMDKNDKRKNSDEIQTRAKLVGVESTENSNVCISMRNVKANHVVRSDDILDYTLKKTSPQKWKDNRKHRSDTILNVDTDHEIQVPQNVHKIALDSLNVEFHRGKLIGVVGPVGAGKSSFLQLLLRELPLESGSISINGSISYASQEPWMFTASIRQNILFGEKYDRKRYNTVIQTCGLKKDFEQLEKGDRTIVGHRGASLSTSQKARINLARACYRNADIYLFDDPLSVVDAHVGTYIFKKSIGPNSRLNQLNATRILVTHQIHYLREADWLVVLKEGKIEKQGTPADLSQNEVNLWQFESIDVEENYEIFYGEHFGKSSPKVKYEEISFEADIKSEDMPMEASSKGNVTGSLSVNYFRAGAQWSVLLILIFCFLFVQFLASASDYWVLIWTRQEEMRTYNKRHNLTATTIGDSSRDISERVSNYSGQIQFLNHASRNRALKFSTKFCLITQASLIVALYIFGIARSLGFYAICLRTSQHLHRVMFNGIISASMRFFETSPTGRILNRFAKDIGAVDEILPKSILDAVQSVLSMLGVMATVAFVNPYFLGPAFILSIFFLFFRRIYLKTSKNIKRLEGITKSPVLTHLAATLTGLHTVRAHGVEQILRGEFDSHQDTHSACWYMTITTRSMFELSMDLVCFFSTCCVISYIMFIDIDVPAEKISLAIHLIGLLRWGVLHCAEASNQMMAVERVLEYKDLDCDQQPIEPVNVDDNWPAEGCIEFRNVFYRHSVDAEPILRNLSFMIKPREKIGIVGRIGAGKSSLIGALFRLAFVEGQILIDGIDTANVHLRELRRHISIIPQDPILFSGTLRRNLDPFEEFSDDAIWMALSSVEMKSIISDPLGLKSKVLAHCSNYSVGQRQLLCLARAILRKSRILLMDESISNIDAQTERLIQQTIRENFIECTVLTIAHRLHTTIDSDRVLIMDSGQIVEFDEPHHLLQNKNSIFYRMVKALGEREYIRLSRAALDKFQSKNKHSSC